MMFAIFFFYYYIFLIWAAGISFPLRHMLRWCHHTARKDEDNAVLDARSGAGV